MKWLFGVVIGVTLALGAAPPCSGRAVHVILMSCSEYANPEHNQIAASCQQDRLLMTNLFSAYYREGSWGARLDLVDLAGKAATHDGFWRALDGIAGRVEDQDTVMVFFTGHGVVDETTRRPQLLACDEKFIDRNRIVERMKELRCKLRILVTDCCSSLLTVEVAEGDADVGGEKALRALLLGHAGFTDVTAAAVGQEAYATSIGGFLTTSLANDMIRFTTWQQVFRETRGRVIAEVRERLNKAQEPQAFSIATPDEGAPPGAASGDQVLPDSSVRALDARELSALSRRNLYLARNEIFARHGHAFRTPFLRSYFAAQSWYREAGTESELSPLETANVDAIRAAEREQGGALVPATASGAGDVFAWSSRELIPRDVLQTMSLRELSLARNELYARHGYIFKSPALRAHFAARPWYRPRTPTQPALSGVEQANRALIEKLERIKGGPFKW